MRNVALTIDGAALRAVTGKGVRIAVIDSGIAQGHPHVGAVSEGLSRAILWAVEARVHIVNLSLGTSNEAPP